MHGVRLYRTLDLSYGSGALVAIADSPQRSTVAHLPYDQILISSDNALGNSKIRVDATFCSPVCRGELGMIWSFDDDCQGSVL